MTAFVTYEAVAANPTLAPQFVENAGIASLLRICAWLDNAILNITIVVSVRSFMFLKELDVAFMDILVAVPAA
jgi:hypothetical protein